MNVIVDYGMGNLNSVRNMLQYLGYEAEISNNSSVIEKAEKIILPGVGNFAMAIESIDKLKIHEILDYKVLEEKKPVLGICLGMQLLLEHSQEGNCQGLGWIKGKVIKFEFPENIDLKVPHMGWDYVKIQNHSPLVADTKENARYYFVHSFFAKCMERVNSVATTNYGIEFDSIIQRENIMGTQFHPEKSHKYGMKILQNFMENF